MLYTCLPHNDSKNNVGMLQVHFALFTSDVCIVFFTLAY